MTNEKGISAAEFQRQQADAAWKASGSQEDPGLEGLRAQARAAKAPQRRESDTGLVVEPPTTKSVVGHQGSKKGKTSPDVKDESPRKRKG